MKPIHLSTKTIFCLLIIQAHGMEKMSTFPLKDASLEEDGSIPELRITNSRYIIMRKRVPWHEAHNLCEKDSRYNRLAVFPKMKDAWEVSLKIFNMSEPYTPEYDTKNGTTEWGLDRRYWIGLVDFLEEGDWQWVKTDGLMLTYDFWFPGQPDHNLGQNKRPEHCATFWNPIYYNNEYHTFNDEVCLNKHYFICEDTPDSEVANADTSRAKMRRIGSFDKVIIDEEGSNSTLPFGVTIGDSSEEGPPRRMGMPGRGRQPEREEDSKESKSLEASGEDDTKVDEGSASNEVIEHLSAEMVSHEERDKVGSSAELTTESEATRVKKSAIEKNVSLDSEIGVSLAEQMNQTNSNAFANTSGNSTLKAVQINELVGNETEWMTLEENENTTFTHSNNFTSDIYMNSTTMSPPKTNLSSPIGQNYSKIGNSIINDNLILQ